jgi:excisionase family DNA binding protein
MLEELRGKRTAMNVREIAKLLQISEREIYKLASANRIPHFKIGCSVRFDPLAVASWLEERMLTSSPRRSPASVTSHADLISRSA